MRAKTFTLEEFALDRNKPPSEEEKKLVAELKAIRRQAERQMRRLDRVLAKEAAKKQSQRDE